MEDLNDIYFFVSVVQYGGFSAAARTIGVEKVVRRSKRTPSRFSSAAMRLHLVYPTPRGMLPSVKKSD